jgi:hypothetical protein
MANPYHDGFIRPGSPDDVRPPPSKDAVILPGTINEALVGDSSAEDDEACDEVSLRIIPSNSREEREAMAFPGVIKEDLGETSSTENKENKACENSFDEVSTRSSFTEVVKEASRKLYTDECKVKCDVVVSDVDEEEEDCRDISKPSRVSSGSSCSRSKNRVRARMDSKCSALSTYSMRSRQDILTAADTKEFRANLQQSHGLRTLEGFRVTAHYIVGVSRKYSAPLISGVLLALVWSNVDESSYHTFNDSPIIPGAAILGHDLSLHFLVNDLFMCLFFGLAVKEVTEGFLPGGSLNPIRRAINPIFATVGGVIGPTAAFAASVTILHSAGAFASTDCSEGDPGGGSAHRRLTGGDHGGAAGSLSDGGAFENVTWHQTFMGIRRTLIALWRP